MKRLFIQIFCFVAFLAEPVSARDWFVNPETGSDENDGSFEAPLATAQVAVNRSGQSDRIVLLPENSIYRQSISLKNGVTDLIIEGNGVTLSGADILPPEQWEKVGDDLYRIKLPNPDFDRQMLIVDGAVQRMGGYTSSKPVYPEAEALTEGQFRWDPIDDETGWLTLRGETGAIERPVRRNGLATGGEIRNVKVFNLSARHCLNDGFNIHGDAKGMQFFNIQGYENYDEGFSAHDTSECWISGSVFLRNENAVADVNQADTYYDNCIMGESWKTEVLFQGGRHSLTKCRIIPASGSVPFSLEPGSTAGSSVRNVPASLLMQGVQFDLSKGTPAPASIGPSCFLYHDNLTAEALTAINLKTHSTAKISQSLFNTYPIGRDESKSPIMAWSGGGSIQGPSNAYRIIHLGRHSPDEIAPKISPENDWLGLTSPLATADFPPTGDAYAPGNTSSHAIWRWIGLTAPDAVFIPETEEGTALATALQENPPAGVGMVNIFLIGEGEKVETETRVLPLQELKPGYAKQNMILRLNRNPRDIISRVGRHYGLKFGGSYIDAMAFIAKENAGVSTNAVSEAEKFLNKNPGLPRSPGKIAGTILFADLPGDPARDRVIEVANLAFDESGAPLPAMPGHNEMSDSVFMAPPLLTKAGLLSEEEKYFTQAASHIRFIQKHCLREDGLYRHSPVSDAAWGRGNAFPALGLAMVLTDFPEEHPDRVFLEESFLSHIEALTAYQNHEGMWHQIIDMPDSYAEFTATAMIASAIARGIRIGVLKENEWLPRLYPSWKAIKSRISFDGKSFVNVCESTGKQPTLEAYYERKAILGPDARAGAMALFFASEMRLLNQ